MTPVADDVSLDNEASMVTSSISRFVGSTHFFEGAYKVLLDSEASMVTLSLEICQFFEGAHSGECMLWYRRDFRI